MTSYRNINLVSRNINCNAISEEEFVKAMFSDLLEAEEKYNELYAPEHVTNIIKSFESHMNREKINAEAYANKTWKTEKKRNAYIMKKLADDRNKFNFNQYYYGLSFFDFNVNPGSISLSSNCTISYDNLTYDKLKKCFNEIKNNEYFKKATGWVLTYEAHVDSYQTCFRPQIKLIVDEETQKKMNEDAENLTKAVNKFYSGCTYFGD